MENLACHIRGIDDEFEPGMPCGINTCGKDGIIPHIYLFNGSIVCYDSSAHVLTGMELHPFRVVLLIVVAVNTLSVASLGAEHIVVDDAFIVVFQTALINGQFFIGDIRRRNKAITDVGINGIGRNVDVERLETRPTIVFLYIHLHLDGIAFGSLSERLPVIGIGLYLMTITNNLCFAGRKSGHHIICLAINLEGQRCDIDRYCNVCIVRVDIGEFV